MNSDPCQTHYRLPFLECGPAFGSPAAPCGAAGEQSSVASLDGPIEHSNKFLAPAGAAARLPKDRPPDYAPSNPSKIMLYAVDRHARAAQDRGNRIDLPDPDLGHKDAVGCQQPG